MYLGSPPQVRGKQKAAALNYLPIGITPAGAGKTGGKDRSGVSNGDHPRRCGENVCRRNICMSFAGSPPQVRGKLDESVLTAIFYGITPAGAGKTPLIVFQSTAPGGSPPQVRGKHLGGAPYSKSPRITPAGAGKTVRTGRRSRFSRDHPRRCGENWSILRFGRKPPRITPAGAGKTLRVLLKMQPHRDHPRRCGENSLI